ncbi:hypothetical protein ADUPG1_009243 [Aduncisulcus paluster]|uniref:Uncharacterized protein n=1 Tax=Aduncisulcus paluster TaxID=2918883 RepID=A0ABQ5KUV0_9EUKA|nr:hypothetical protein ADUPG1_009243 [Aduncisulcus paluster]
MPEEEAFDYHQSYFTSLLDPAPVKTMDCYKRPLPEYGNDQEQITEKNRQMELSIELINNFKDKCRDRPVTDDITIENTKPLLININKKVASIKQLFPEMNITPPFIFHPVIAHIYGDFLLWCSKTYFRFMVSGKVLSREYSDILLGILIVTRAIVPSSEYSDLLKNFKQLGLGQIRKNLLRSIKTNCPQVDSYQGCPGYWNDESGSERLDEDEEEDKDISALIQARQEEASKDKSDDSDIAPLNDVTDKQEEIQAQEDTLGKRRSSASVLSTKPSKKHSSKFISISLPPQHATTLRHLLQPPSSSGTQFLSICPNDAIVIKKICVYGRINLDLPLKPPPKEFGKVRRVAVRKSEGYPLPFIQIHQLEPLSNSQYEKTMEERVTKLLERLSDRPPLRLPKSAPVLTSFSDSFLASTGIYESTNDRTLMKTYTYLDARQDFATVKENLNKVLSKFHSFGFIPPFICIPKLHEKLVLFLEYTMINGKVLNAPKMRKEEWKRWKGHICLDDNDIEEDEEEEEEEKEEEEEEEEEEENVDFEAEEEEKEEEEEHSIDVERDLQDDEEEEEREDREVEVEIEKTEQADEEEEEEKEEEEKENRDDNEDKEESKSEHKDHVIDSKESSKNIQSSGSEETIEEEEEEESSKSEQ